VKILGPALYLGEEDLSDAGAEGEGVEEVVHSYNVLLGGIPKRIKSSRSLLSRHGDRKASRKSSLKSAFKAVLDFGEAVLSPKPSDQSPRRRPSSGSTMMEM